MKAVTLLETGTDWPMIGTVILTGDIEGDEQLLLSVLSDHFEAEVTLTHPINWGWVTQANGVDVRVKFVRDEEECFETLDMQNTWLYAKSKYYLFGSYVVRQYEQGDHNNVVEGLIECDGTLQEFESLCSPTTVIDACEGWDSFCEISEDEFKMYAKGINDNHNQ
jgi:hypothetical protein